jgi:hypothetical protein
MEDGAGLSLSKIWFLSFPLQLVGAAWGEVVESHGLSTEEMIMEFFATPFA